MPVGDPLAPLRGGASEALSRDLRLATGHGDRPHLMSRSPRPKLVASMAIHKPSVVPLGRQAGDNVPDCGARSKYPFERSPCPVRKGTPEGNIVPTPPSP